MDLAGLKSFGAGVYRGLVTLKPWEDDISSAVDQYVVVGEKKYHYHAGYIFGTLIQLASIFVLAKYGHVIV